MLTPISVVIPLHNRADLASQCLASLARWTTPLEILVVDDGSTDPGVELLRRAGLAHQWLRHPQAVVKEFQHGVRLNFFPTLSISLLLRSVAVLPHSTTLSPSLGVGSRQTSIL